MLQLKHFGANHTKVKINAENYFEDLDRMIYHFDEPYNGGLPLWHVLKQSGKKFGVILTGLGGDELFSKVILKRYLKSFLDVLIFKET